MFSKGFRSQKEYDGYLACYKKLAIGDCVDVYIRGGNPVSEECPLKPNSDRLVRAKVIGKVGIGFVFATKEYHTGFWVIPDYNCFDELTIDAKEYPFGWYSGGTDHRLARIIKCRNQHRY